jgi:hypothetical protein
MYDPSGELTVILIIIWWLQKLGKDCQQGNKAEQKTDVETINLKKLSEREVTKQFQIELSKRFAAVENLNDNKDINRAWENIKVKIKSKLKRH